MGIGWELSVGSISGDLTDATYGYPEFGLALEMSGVGGSLVIGPSDGRWHVDQDPSLRVELLGGDASACELRGYWDEPCTWRITGGDGTQYLFAHARDVWDSAENKRRYYQWDLSAIIDVHGNRVDVTYNDISRCLESCTSYFPRGAVVDAYPTQVTWNAGRYKVEFDIGPDSEYDPPPFTNWPRLRQDSPRDLKFSGCSSYAYVAPTVMEIRRLKSLRVKVDGALVRQYDFAYNTTPFSYQTSGCGVTNVRSGTMTLASLAEKGRDGSVLRTHAFEYAYTASVTFIKQPSGNSFTWPLLTRWNNGFGGSVQFSYQYRANPNDGWAPFESCWSANVVSSKRASFGAGQPDLTVTYAYALGPDAGPHFYLLYSQDPCITQEGILEVRPSTLYRSQRYYGFGSVTETFADGTRIEHEFHTGRQSFTYNAQQGWWETSDLTDVNVAGRERESRLFGPDGTLWRRVVNTWNFAGSYYGNIEVVPRLVFLQRTDEYLKDGSRIGTSFTYDAYGNVTEVHQEGDPAFSSDDTYTQRPYHANTAVWLFVPKYERIVDEAGVELALTNFYYDGANSREALPTKGRLTAQSVKLNGTQTSNTYFVYDGFGNRIKESQPTYTAPESQPAGPAEGWIPSGVPYSETVYDATYHVFPVQQINPLGHTTTAEYDVLLGKPTRIVEPTGHWTELRYDGLGRLTKVWDNLDSEAYPTKAFTYTWGALPNKTVIEERTQHGTPYTRRTVVCMDGFGREVERLETFTNIALSSVRTDYDERGFKAVQTNPVYFGTAAACPSTMSSVASRDRVAYTYDPLGNVTRTMFLKANETTGPYTETIHSGLTTTIVDERSNRVTHVRNLGARTLTVKEPSSGAKVTLRPTAQGAYAQWIASPDVTHYQNVDDTTPDDGATYIHEGGWHERDTHVFGGANLSPSAVIDRVILRFRWKHYDVATPNPANGMWALFRQNGVVVQGPTYRRSNDQGWGEDAWVMDVNPRTGQPWTAAEINAGLEFGFEVYPAAGSAPYVTQAYVEVVVRSAPTVDTIYQFDRLGRLTGVTDPVGNVTSLTYDLGGRKIAMDDPDMGAWTYTYDAAGNLTSQTDARGVTTTLYYDALGRVTSKIYSNGDPRVYFYYDTYPDPAQCPQGVTAKGRVVQELVWPMGPFRRPCYDVRGREVMSRVIVDGATYDIRRTFDALDQVADITYPDGEVVHQDGGTYGNVYSATSTTYGETLFSSAYRTPAQQPAQVALGNGLTTVYTYDSRLRLSRIQTGAVQDLALTYDEASNVTGVTDGTTGEVALYSYDQLNRLTGMAINGAPVASYQYDAIGNMTYKEEGGLWAQMFYSPAFTGTAHAPLYVYGPITNVFTYDPNGNLLTVEDSLGAVRSYAFDAENRLKERPYGDSRERYTYDARGELTKSAIYGGGADLDHAAYRSGGVRRLGCRPRCRSLPERGRRDARR